jgi:hypothetical protein
LGFIREEVVDFCYGTVEGHDGESMIGHIEDQVLSHHGQADQSEITTRRSLRMLADVAAGKTSAKVSLVSEIPIGHI